MSLGLALGGIITEISKVAAKVATSTVNIPATAKGKGINGIEYVRAWGKDEKDPAARGWKASQHAANVFKAFNAGNVMPWRWVPVQVNDSPRLIVYVMHDAIAIGDSPPARIPLNASNYQRLADRLGKQLGKKLLAPTPKIVDMTHLAAVNGNGRAIEAVSIWGDPAEPRENLGQNVAQWLRQQERIKKAVDAAGGYPTSGVLSTVGKDATTGPRLADIAKPTDASGEAVGAKMMIYGWHAKAKPETGREGPWVPHVGAASELVKRGWLSVRQSESGKHADLDTGADQGMGGFWDYSSVERYVLDDCLLDGKPASLSTIYTTMPGLVYVFPAGALPKPIPTRYPMLPLPVA